VQLIVLDLLLEDWGRKRWVKWIVKRVKVIVSFIWQHHAPLAIFRHYKINLMPQNPIETWFATNFLMIEWLLKMRSIVQQTIECWHGGVDQLWHHGVLFMRCGCDYKCYILLHMLGLVIRDSFSNNML
jgi:hypothetical protein